MALDYWTVAVCDTNLSRSDYNFSADPFHPDLCRNWETMVDGSLENWNLIPDDTVRVTMDRCASHRCITEIPPPRRLCLSKPSVLSSSLEGTYVQSGVQGLDGSVEYMKERVTSEEAQSFLYYWYVCIEHHGHMTCNMQHVYTQKGVNSPTLMNGGSSLRRT